ncbi:MrcB family domain-containing protein [Arsukibacterium sp.]|uniref:MrcB family domain-containing protein n=1 Tax=Arsukibacterium sp. TaxID=1977258 RepID=UPI002FD956BD
MSLREKLIQVTCGWVKATTEKFTGHPIANVIRQGLIEEVKAAIGHSQGDYLIKASAGAGNWASVPWISILDPQKTKSTQAGVYPVYLFRADGAGVYLSLGFGTTELTNKFGAKNAKKKALEIKDTFRSKDKRLEKWNASIDLKSNTPLGKSYEWATAGAKFYPSDDIPEDVELLSDLREMLDIYSGINIPDKVSDELKVLMNHSVSKPFILLAGISGTGKSRFVRQQAAAQGNEKEFLQMVPVRPDWHEPSDLLGYVSRIGGTDRFIVTDALRFMVKAWKATGAVAAAMSDGRIGWTGKPLDSINTYWLCLDEMNLAPVEQYFADYLSVIESRSWLHNDEADSHDYVYCCEPILTASALQVVTDQTALAKELGLDIETSAEDQQLWDAFLQHGIPVPFNLIVAGTVNMDETTHGFSRKVIDRALTFDFGRFFPNAFANLWAGQPVPKTLGFARYSHAKPELLADCKEDNDGLTTISFLQAVNDVLRDTPFELAYRALNELLLAVICHSPADKPELQAVWDDFMMCKVLPRIEGDDEKLSVSSDNFKTENLLDKLEQVLEKQLTAIWLTTRPELLLESANQVPCRSKAKLKWMKDRLERNSFTSFWP